MLFFFFVSNYMVLHVFVVFVLINVFLVNMETDEL